MPSPMLTNEQAIRSHHDRHQDSNHTAGDYPICEASMSETETIDLARNILEHLTEQAPDEYSDDELTQIYTWLGSTDTSSKTVEQLADEYDLGRF